MKEVIGYRKANKVESMSLWVQTNDINIRKGLIISGIIFTLMDGFYSGYKLIQGDIDGLAYLTLALFFMTQVFRHLPVFLSVSEEDE